MQVKLKHINLKRMKSEEAHKGMNRSLKEFYTTMFNQLVHKIFPQARHKLSAAQSWVISSIITKRILKYFSISSEAAPYLTHAIEMLAHKSRAIENLQEDKMLLEFILQNFNLVVCEKNNLK